MMKSKRLWEERFLPTEKGWGLFDISLDPGKQILLVAAFEKGLHRFQLDPIDGGILEKQQIKEKAGHLGNVIKVAWHPSGKRFATCGTDNLTIVWKASFSVERQIRSVEVPQVLAWNPKIFHVLCAGGTELVSANLNSQSRDPTIHKLQSNIRSMAWNNAGEIYALGLDNGSVSLRDKLDNEFCVIHRFSDPVWTLCWAPPHSPAADLLAVGDWSRNVGFYESTGKQRGVDRAMDFLPLSLTFSSDGQVIFVCGADRKVHALSSELVYIGVVADFRSWPLQCLQRQQNLSKTDLIVISADGMVNAIEATYGKCSHLYAAICASRESLVNVCVRNLERNREVTVQIQDSIQRIAVYRNMFAVATSRHVVIYRQNPDEVMMKYEEIARTPNGVDCKKLLLSAQHLLLVQTSSIQSVSFAGNVVQLWTTEDEIQCSKVIGGKPGNELVLCGLRNGVVCQIMLSQPFLRNLQKTPSVPACLDLNLNLSRLAVVCENTILYVYDLETKALLYQEVGADSCAWNLHHPHIIAYSMHSMLKIKLGEYKPHTRRMEAPLQGIVTGYAGNKVFYDTDGRVVVVEVPHAVLIHQSIEMDNFQDAYDIACFGTSDSDWKVLGNRALEKLNLSVAKNCVRRERNFPLLMLIEEIEQRTKLGDGNSDIYLGDVFAFRGRFEEAARFYSKGGCPELSVKLFMDLRQFKQAEQWATTAEQKAELLQLRAEWAVKDNDKRTAIGLFLELGEIEKAFEAMKEMGWASYLAETARKLNADSQRELIAEAAKYLEAMDDIDSAVDLYERIKEIKLVVNLKLLKRDWKFLLGLADREPFYREMILMPYAEYLIENDQFTEAQVQFARAGHPEVATIILSELVKVAVEIRRFSDAAFYNWLCGKNSEEAAVLDGSNFSVHTKSAAMYYERAEVYYAYEAIDGAVEDPFIALPVETIFNRSRILASMLWNKQELPDGIRLTCILYVLATSAMKMQAYKTARIALERLKELRLPKRLLAKFTETLVQNRCRPFQDPENLSDYCHSCSSFTPLLNNQNGYACQSCSSPFIYCQVSFEHLPLIEFKPEASVTNSEALTLVAAEPSKETAVMSTGSGDRMRFGDREVASRASSSNGSFFAGMQRNVGPVVVSRKVLKQLKEEDVVVLKLSSFDGWRFYRNMLSDVARVVSCDSCWKLFNYDDYFASILDFGCCPFCRKPRNLHSETDA